MPCARRWECPALPPRSVAQARGEFVFLALRCRDGFAVADFTARFGLDPHEAFPHLAGLERDGLLARAADRWHLTPRGLLVADSVFTTFL